MLDWKFVCIIDNTEVGEGFLKRISFLDCGDSAGSLVICNTATNRFRIKSSIGIVFEVQDLNLIFSFFIYADIRQPDASYRSPRNLVWRFELYTLTWYPLTTSIESKLEIHLLFLLAYVRKFSLNAGLEQDSSGPALLQRLPVTDILGKATNNGLILRRWLSRPSMINTSSSSTVVFLPRFDPGIMLKKLPSGSVWKLIMTKDQAPDWPGTFLASSAITRMPMSTLYDFIVYTFWGNFEECIWRYCLQKCFAEQYFGAKT